MSSHGKNTSSGLLVGFLLLLACNSNVQAASFAEAIEGVQPRIVKIFGAGGLQGLEAYQSGFLISDDGYVLTVSSTVLDTDYITVVLDDGRKFQAEYVGYDPRIEIAVLKVDATGLVHFNLDECVDLDSGDRVLAFSNLYGVATGNEPASVLHGSVSTTTNLEARRGAFATTYRGRVYILDAMTNNPGAAGGALTDRQGRLAAVLGKELRNSLNNTWLNYAIPIAEVTQSIEDIRAGKLIIGRREEDRRRPLEPMALADLGITLIPDVLNKTPPFIDRVLPDSPAEKAKLQVDDLILFVNDRLVASCKAVNDELGFIERDAELTLIIERNKDLVEVVVRVE